MTVKRSWSYIIPQDLAPLFQVPGVTFVNLQYDADDNDFREIREWLGGPLHHWSDLDQYNDLEQVMALVDNLDLVISVNNASSRIASALGKETWLMERGSIWNFGQYYVPFFSNTRAFLFSDFEDRQELVRSIANKLIKKVKND